MNEWTTTPGISKACFIGGIIAMSGACYALGLPDEASNRTVRAKEDSVIWTDQRPAFLAYIERRQMPSASLVERVSVGDVLPQSGVSYYDIPLYFGGAFIVAPSSQEKQPSLIPGQIASSR
jgi:hypothetical protein